MKYYSTLWQYATEASNPHEIPALTVVLADRRPAFRSVGYCDLALGDPRRSRNSSFDIEAAAIPEPDAAISRALACIKAHPNRFDGSLAAAASVKSPSARPPALRVANGNSHILK